MPHQKVTPIQSLKVFTDKLIDYAGLFPPASLDLTQAFHNYLFYLEGHFAWMLSRFICPAKKLNELSELMKHMKGDDSQIIPFSVIGSASETEKEFLINLSNDTELISAFRFEHESRVETNVYEIRLPNDAMNNTENIVSLISKSDEIISQKLGSEVSIFFEASITENFESSIDNLITAIANQNTYRKCSGFKLRTGGIVASAFPTTEQIAYAILRAKDKNVPMKCTAGLHHPVRHYNESVLTKMHGFLNVFGAGILAYCHHLDFDEVVEILDDENSYNFNFDADGFLWKDYLATEEEIEKARNEFIISYGSCSFIEPIDDLKTLELL